MTKSLSKSFYYLIVLLLFAALIASFSSPSVTNFPQEPSTYAATAPTSSDNWQDSSSYRDTSWSGSGTPSSPYLITSASELAGLAYQVNAGNTYSGIYFKQTAYIDLSAHYWTPIGNSSTICFSGNYDGDGFTISGLFTEADTSHQGLFGYIRGTNTNYATIENVGITDSFIQGTSSVGSIVGRIYYANVISCYNTSDISASSDYVGGIVGYANNSVILNCYNKGKILANRELGGILGYSNTCIIANCYNLGEVSYTSRGYEVGGITGNHSGQVVNCFNLANVIGDDEVGGIIGYTWGGAGSGSVVGSGSSAIFCYNAGKIEGDEEVGGIIGYTRSGSIQSSFNIGSISGNIHVGGITGYNSFYTAYLDDCINTGSVSGNSYVGGVAGWLERNDDVTNCTYGGSCSRIGGINGADTTGAT